MCIRNLRLGRLSRFIPTIRSLRSFGVRAILCIWAAVSPVAGWIWRLYHATEDGRLFNYPVHLSRWRSRPSAIWLRAELWVHRNRTLARSPASATATTHAPLLGSGEQVIGGLAKQLPGGLAVEGVEAPLPAPLLAHQPRFPELLHVVGDLRLSHAEVVLELADADAFVLACVANENFGGVHVASFNSS